MRKTLFVSSFMVYAFFSVFAQTSSETNRSGAQNPSTEATAGAEDIERSEVFAPFPSRIRVGLKGAGVVVSWEDSKDLDGSYLIYRFTEEISTINLSKALKVGEVLSGVKTFLDSPADAKPNFYCVLAKDSSGLVYDVIIPFKNATMTGISAAVKEPEKKKEEIADITGIKAEVDADSIIVSYTVSLKNRSLILYRSISPVTGPMGLTEATLVSIYTDQDGKFQDYPVPGVDYYYVLIDEMHLRSGNIPIIRGANSTIQAVRIPPGDFRIGLPEISSLSRDVPLPYLVLSATVTRGSTLSSKPLDLPQTKNLSSETAKAVDRITLLSGWKEVSMPSIFVFPEDAVLAGSVGEEYTLRSILADQFAKKNWPEAVDRLVKFLSIHRTPQTTARAQFYLGQALAKSDKYRDAFFSFLLSQSYYAPATSVWIEYLLRKLR